MEYLKYKETINIKLNELYKKYPIVYEKIEEVSVSPRRNCVMIYFSEGNVMLDITAHYSRIVGVADNGLPELDQFCEEMELFLLENSVRRRKNENE